MRFSSLIAAVLLALWLPATVHCGLDAAGLLGSPDACCHHEGDTDHADRDACGIVEGGDYRPANNLLKISAPIVVIHLFCLIEIAPETSIAPAIIVSVEVESPPEFQRTWHFVARAAPSPRAPSLILA